MTSPPSASEKDEEVNYDAAAKKKKTRIRKSIKKVYDNIEEDKKKAYLEELENKDIERFSENFTTLAMLCFLKENVKKHYLTE